ncbi:MAG: V-type ATP synthase subunit A [Candidatus Marsarchaeota archaeon]|jgi:V/A-type H+-transporting ATPase subunit A|nr:V-type ATP synthase subunit A [Candidatus Marsarchaeota archaeon]MCL5112024.1 V-type ATP synthase subunit A [Candidatus Marsarchaeota archaeon]
MADKGRIFRISGPVVIAENLKDPKMYNVVKVGEEELVGEIIRLNSGRATIQVYEDTSGLRPGAPVEDTGSQLSVSLGPGLIGSIYDGIQRPLDKIKAKSGDFIARGVNVDPIDLKKKWEFTPTAKSGDKVKPGDIIGEVKETGLVTNRVLVPNGISGRIAHISGGKYNVTESIASVSDGGSSFNITLMQKWPVRVARPVIDKLPPDVPLITGQRIIDTLFPVAKGGTAAVPGPFGSGKCVDKDTLLMMGNGRIVSIEEVYNEGRAKGKLVYENDNEELYDVSGLGNPSALSLNGNKFDIREPKHVYRGKTDSTIKVLTKSGKRVEVTPIHRLFTLSDCAIVEKEAGTIQKGDYLACPRKVSLELSDQKIHLISLLHSKKLFSADENLNARFGVLLKSAIKKGRLPLRFNQYLRVGRPVPLELIHMISGDSLQDPDTIISYHGKRIKVPRVMSPELAEYLGYIIADGNLKNGSYSIRFYNTSKEILDRYAYLARRLFGVEPYIYRHPKTRTSMIAQIDCKALFDSLVSLGVPYKGKAGNASIPELLLKSSDASLTSFIGSYIACDGSVDVDNGRIEIISKSRKIIEQFSFVLLRLGLVSSIGKTRKDGTSRISVKVGGVKEAYKLGAAIRGAKSARFLKIVEGQKTRYSNKDAIPVPGTLKSILKTKGTQNRLMRIGVYPERYLKDSSRICITTLTKIIERLSRWMEVPKELLTLRELSESLFFDEVKAIEWSKVPKDVFDVEIPELHNFVGGHGPLLLHNTVIQHQLAKWSDADVIVYIGCGERSNEMAEILTTFPQLKDPKSGLPLMDRTILIANTSNMPVAARESSIYTGITLAEYYRDMGYNVALMADSTSRWAEALREISGRLEEMPGEEGYPAYLGRKIAEFYERAGRVHVLNGAVGSVTAIGAVSPPGGDTSEPVSQNTLRVTRVFWALDASLANRRHFPSINWLNSYSLYLDDLAKWYDTNIDKGWNEMRSNAMAILQKEAEINEVVQLVGYDALPEKEKEVLDIAKVIREDYLQQSAYDEVDTYSSTKKQYLMLKAILLLDAAEKNAIDKGVTVDQLQKTDAKQKIARMKFAKEDDIQGYFNELKRAIDGIAAMESKAKEG